ncbi:MAG: hypothetical protein OIF58_07375 [Cohaesibacter sp.]|nr:hypothetical protein [Cohaesibacter sp.]
MAESTLELIMRDLFWHLEKLGRVRLSEHFYLRQFLYSEIAVAYNIPNMPDNPDLAIETGTRLCQTILEPMVAEFGPIVIRSGFRSARLNDFGCRKGLKCASNAKNYAAHIWDHLDHQGCKGASACIVIPAFNDGQTKYKTWPQLSRHLQATLPCTEPKRFKYDNAFNIGYRISDGGIATRNSLVRPILRNLVQVCS